MISNHSRSALLAMKLMDRSARSSANSLLHEAPLAVLLAIVIVDCVRYANVDLWGHVVSGNAMLQEERIIVSEPYSYCADGQVWHNHEWLSEVMMGCAYDTLGNIGLKLLKFVCSGVTIAFQ
jgi:hypothetical protein